MSFLLGIDAGSNGITAVVSSLDLKPLGTETRARSARDLAVCETSAEVLAAVRGALEKSGVRASEVSSSCVALACTAEAECADALRDALTGELPGAAVEIVPEAAAVREAEFPAAAGVICLAGRGSVAYGRNERGVTARAGGWGATVSDEGSAPWIGRKAVAQCLRALDMGRSSHLITGIMNHWRIATREQLVQRCNHGPLPDFSEIFPIVRATADGGDALASEILTATGGELARMTQVVIRRLWVGRVPLEIALCGKVFSTSPAICQVFSNVVRNERPEIRVRTGNTPVSVGALQLARGAMAVK